MVKTLFFFLFLFFFKTEQIHVRCVSQLLVSQDFNLASNFLKPHLKAAEAALIV